MRRLATLVVALAVLATTSAASPAAESARRLPTPIIAELYATPAAFVGKSVRIYGLVIDADPSRGEFVLQDVSQHPLRIVGNRKLKAAPGDQLIVIGRLRMAGNQPYLAAQAVLPTQVLGGGGCC
ncbi:MAG TPA: hypothetical protein VMB84_04150 [Stellaceae bacterium]|nr:hypothetical protein [Stellaceae bacterium]